MSQLQWSAIPGAFDLPDGDLAAGEPVTDYVMVKISQNAKFGAVRHERIFMGWYQHGDTVPLPTSPVDGYQYSLAECSFQVGGFITRPPAPGFVSGQQARPTPADTNTNGAGGDVNYMFYDVDDSTGDVTFFVEFYIQGGAGTDTYGGCVKVYAHCQRLSQTLTPGSGGD